MYKMLIVDDEPLIREYIRKNTPLLNESWVTAAEAMDGVEALGLMEKQQFDLVVTDIKMPEMDGLELAKAISVKYPGQKVAILSGYDEFSFAKKAMGCGVLDYLLKPIVKEEFRSLLDKMALQIEAEKREQAAYKTLKALSEDSRIQVARNFLKAVVSDSNVEIKALYPLVHRLRIDLIESEGSILTLELDEDILLERAIPPSDIPVYKFILNQMASEILEDEPYSLVFFDGNENTNVLLSGENTAQIMEKCRNAFTRISAAMIEHTGISITAAAGTPVNDVLQLNASYGRACDMMFKRLEAGGNRLFFYAEEGVTGLAEKDFFEKALSAIKRALLDNSETACHFGLANYINQIKDPDILSVFRYGIHLIKSIAMSKPGYPDEKADAALKVLNSLRENHKGDISEEDILRVYKNMLAAFMVTPEDHHAVNEHDIVLKAKDYIYSHYSEPISLALVAEKAGVSPSYLSDLFHKSVGESYIKFVTRIRMEQAAKLLKSVPAPRICDIPEKVGYISVKHFSYVFKQHFNMTPGEYQERGKT